VLVGLPQRVDGLDCYLLYNTFFYFYNTHQVLVGLPQGDGSLIILFILFLFHFILLYFYNTHQVLVGLPQGVGGLAISF
jgi:hypothetical protein